MRKLYYMGLESYQGRYTLQLSKTAKNMWDEDTRRFASRF